MKKIILLVAVLSLIGCRKEPIIEKEIEYVFEETPCKHCIKLILDNENMISSDSECWNNLSAKIYQNSIDSSVFYEEKIGYSAYQNLTFSFLKNLSGINASDNEKAIMYQVGDLKYGNIVNRKEGLVIQYMDDSNVLWSTEMGNQNVGSFIHTNYIGNYFENFGLFIQLYIDCKLYNSNGDFKVLKGEMSSKALLIY